MSQGYFADISHKGKILYGDVLASIGILEAKLDRERAASIDTFSLET
jgi:hypothetical protein